MKYGKPRIEVEILKVLGEECDIHWYQESHERYIDYIFDLVCDSLGVQTESGEVDRSHVSEVVIRYMEAIIAQLVPAGQ